MAGGFPGGEGGDVVGVDKIRETGRSAQGVTLIKTGEDDMVTSASLLAPEGEDDEEGTEE